MRSNDGHFVPHAQLPDGEISPERPLMLNPPLNLLREVRASADHAYDRHGAVDNTGTWHDVQRALPNPIFHSESVRRVYASMDDIRRGTLTSLYEGRLQLWISVSMPNISESAVKRQLWEMANEWLHRIGRALDSRGGYPTDKLNLKIYIEFRDADPPERPPKKPNTRDLIALCSVEMHDEPNSCRAVFDVGFLSGFRIAENIAERLFVRCLTRAFLALLGVVNRESEVAKIEGLVVENDEARSFHFFHAQHFLDYVRDTLPEDLVTVDPIDDASVKIGLGQRVIEKDQRAKIEGRKECTGFLGKVVDALFAEIIDSLAAFDRLSTLKRLVANCEKANAEEDIWTRTSAALLGLHGRKTSTKNCIVERLSKFANAAISSRTLTEIALCVCPIQGGEKLSNIELSKLIARAALVIRLGGLSDAIHFNALAPELTISPLGDILFRDEFGHLVVEPMLSKVVGGKFIANAPLQMKNYEDPEIVPDVKSKVSEEFWETWKIEMGFDVDEGRRIIGALEDKGIADHTAVYEIEQSEFFTLVCSDEVSRDAAARFLNQFSLSTRPQWDTPPKALYARISIRGALAEGCLL